MTSTDVGALAQAWSDALLAINKAASAATADPTPLAVSGQVSAMADHADVLLKHPSPRAECNDIARELKELLVDARDSYAGAAEADGQRRTEAMNDGNEAIVAAGAALSDIADTLCPLPQSVVDLLGKN